MCLILLSVHMRMCQEQLSLEQTLRAAFASAQYVIHGSMVHVREVV